MPTVLRRAHLLIALLLILGIAAYADPSIPHASAQSGGCMFLSSPASTPAFCDTFDQPAGTTGNRSGDLNGTVWGVSRIIAGGNDTYSSGTNPSQGQINNFAPVALQGCGSSLVPVYPDHDVRICNGQVVEGVNDDGGQTVLAMYPKQPFDIAGRTGTVVFDVSANSEGPHAAWPTFVYTDQPVPAPYSSSSGIDTSARNSFGFTIASPDYITGNAAGPCGGNGTSVDSMFVTRNYQLSSIPFTEMNCVVRPSSPTQLNHFEVRLSESQVQVWATDPGSTTLREIAQASNVNLPLTRGLIWMEDTHYNANKFNSQQSHTFGWDNVGFDGPVLPRDLTFDALENGLLDVDPRWPNHPGMQLGWTTDATVTVPNVSNVSQAQAALVTFNWFATDTSVPSISVNGNAAITTSWPFDGVTYVWRTIAVPVPLSEIKAGVNTITIRDAWGVAVANVDIILVGAGGIPSGGTPTPTPSPSPTPPPTPAPTPTPIAINNVPCTVMLPSGAQTGTCSGTFTPSK